MANLTKPFWSPLVAGRLYSSSISAAAVTTGAVVANTLYAIPVFTPLAVTVSLMGLEVTTFAAGNAHLGIYNDSAGVPGSLLLDAGTINTGVSNGFKSIGSLSTILAAATWYWLAAVFNATPSVRVINTGNSLHLLGFTSGTDTTVHTGWSVAFTYAALPDPFTGGGALMTTNPARILIQV